MQTFVSFIHDLAWLSWYVLTCNSVVLARSCTECQSPIAIPYTLSTFSYLFIFFFLENTWIENLSNSASLEVAWNDSMIENLLSNANNNAINKFISRQLLLCMFLIRTRLCESFPFYVYSWSCGCDNAEKWIWFSVLMSVIYLFFSSYFLK
jgi:hypothetical protein